MLISILNVSILSLSIIKCKHDFFDGGYKLFMLKVVDGVTYLFMPHAIL